MSTPTATKLPQLLATLPQSGLHTIVRPLLPPPRLKDSIFLVTRTHLKYKLLPPKPPASPPDPTPTPTSNRGNTAATAKAPPIAPRRAKVLTPRRDNIGGGVGLAGLIEGEGEVLVYGKAWGMQFSKGKFSTPKTVTKLPDPLIEPHKIKWISVPRSSLTPEETAAVDNWKTTYDEVMAKREVVFEGRKVEGQVRREEHAVKVKEREEEKVRLKKEKDLVRIVY